MKGNRVIIVWGLVWMMVMVTGCGTKRNTWLSRHYQALVTKYNVLWNGEQAYKEGMLKLYTQGSDDYGQVLPVMPSGNHKDTTLVLADMTRAVEKAQKAQKLHSIRKKPKEDPKRKRDPVYQAFMKKEEYNTQMGKVWLLQGNAQLEKGDYLGAMGTFIYVTKHFTSEPETVIAAEVGLTRAYTEMGWLYDGEDVINGTQRRAIPKHLQASVGAAAADIHLRKGNEMAEATEALEVSARNEKQKRQRVRDYYILGQLYMRQGQAMKAQEAFKQAGKKSGSYQMTLNAKVSEAEAMGEGNKELSLKKLSRMLKREKYAKNRDKIFVAMGNVQQKHADWSAAEQSYRMAIDTAASGSPDRTRAQLLLADMLYKHHRYIEAQPLYAEVGMAMDAGHPDYERVSSRAEVLGLLASEDKVVREQDSMQVLARMEPAERDSVIRAELVKRKIAEEAAAALAAERAKREDMRMMEEQSQVGIEELAMRSQLQSGKQTFYFDNAVAVAAGKREFERKWGQRVMEDNWRRKNKQTELLGEELENEMEEEPTGDEIVGEEEQAQEEKKGATSSDLMQYVENLPLTKEQVRVSNGMIAEALMNMGGLYEERLGDDSMAVVTYEELERRFPKDKRLPDAYYRMYLMNRKSGNTSQATWYKTRLVSKFPESRYAQVLGNPDYEENARRMVAMQDSLYEKTYGAYLRGRYDSVMANYSDMKEKYGLSPLMPKFAFLNALSEAKVGQTEAFEKDMRDLIADYPESDVTGRAKSILALHQQGRTVMSGSTHGSLMAMRDSIVAGEQVAAIDTMAWLDERSMPHVVLVIDSTTRGDGNQLFYDLANYNFKGFLVKDFDMVKSKTDSAVTIELDALSDLQEAFWYIDNLSGDSTIGAYMRSDTVSAVPISTYNLSLVKKGRKMREYLTFYRDSIAPQHRHVTVNAKRAEEERKALMEAVMAAEKMAKEQMEEAERERNGD